MRPDTPYITWQKQAGDGRGERRHEGGPAAAQLRPEPQDPFWEALHHAHVRAFVWMAMYASGLVIGKRDRTAPLRSDGGVKIDQGEAPQLFAPLTHKSPKQTTNTHVPFIHPIESLTY